MSKKYIEPVCHCVLFFSLCWMACNANAQTAGPQRKNIQTDLAQIQQLQREQFGNDNQTTTVDVPNNQDLDQSWGNNLGNQSNDADLLNQRAKSNQQYVAKQSESLSKTAFDSMVNELLPLTPNQIRRLKNMFAASQEASASPPGMPPRPVATSQFVNLAPGSTPPVVRLAQGFVSSVMFIDSTGAPWPIAAFDIGDPNSFNIQWNKKDNMLMIQAKRQYVYGNLAVRLEGLATPVMITLVPGQKAVDYRVDMRVEGIGPDATYVPNGQGIPHVQNDQLLRVLDGVTPDGATILDVSGGTAKAWSIGDKMFLRTKYTLLSPSWLSTLSSADGTNAYELYRSPLILASAHGKVIKLKIKGY